jgi:hypothetical protein
MCGMYGHLASVNGRCIILKATSSYQLVEVSALAVGLHAL